MPKIDDLCGWHNKPKEVSAIMADLPIPVFADVYNPLKDSGRGKIRLLYQFVVDLIGYFPIRLQKIGDCVSQGSACAVDTLKAVEIVLNGEFEEWVAETCTEDIYGGSRIQVGNGQLGYGDGSCGVWAAKYVNTYGTLVRKKYNNIDLSKYDSDKARLWGNPGNGTPKELLSFSKEHVVKTISQIRTYEEARDCIYNGFPITVASNQGFSYTRDKDGFANPEGSWGHQMCFTAADDEYSRPGLLCQNSWGIFNHGPKRNNQPDGSFWVEPEIVNRMLSMNDSWAYSNFNGFQIQDLDLRIV